MDTTAIVKAYRSTLRDLRRLSEHSEWCDSDDCYPQDRRERVALGALADALRAAYRALSRR